MKKEECEPTLFAQVNVLKSEKLNVGRYRLGMPLEIWKFIGFYNVPERIVGWVNRAGPG